MKITFLFFTVLNFSVLIAQSPEIIWSRTYGGSLYDVAEDIYPTSDGGFIVAGNSKSSDGDVSGHIGSSGSTDYWIVKLDSNGDIIWEKNYGSDNQDFAHSIQQTSDGGYIVAGAGYDSNIPDFWIVKLYSNGELEWQVFIGDTYFGEEAYSIQETSDGGYVFVGDSFGSHGNNADYVMVKLNADGQIQWEKSYGGSSTQVSYSVKQTSDNGYIIAGYSPADNGDVSNNYGVSDVWIVKTDELGNLEWEKNYGGSGYEGTGTGVVRSVNIITTINGGYAFASSSTSSDGDISGNNNGYPNVSKADYWIVELDSTGNILWENNFGGYYDDDPKSIAQTSDGGFIVTGFSTSADGDVSGHHGNDYISSDCWVIKVDSSGNKLWENSFGGTSDERCWSVKQLADNSYIVAGWTASNDGDIVTENHGDTDMWVFKLAPDTMQVNDSETHSVTFYPNPAKDFLYFSETLHKINIFSNEGKVVLQVEKNNEINIENLSSGVYYLKAQTLNEKNIRYKFLKQ